MSFPVHLRWAPCGHGADPEYIYTPAFHIGASVHRPSLWSPADRKRRVRSTPSSRWTDEEGPAEADWTSFCLLSSVCPLINNMQILEQKSRKKWNLWNIFSQRNRGQSPGRSNSDLWRGYEGPEESAWLEFATVWIAAMLRTLYQLSSTWALSQFSGRGASGLTSSDAIILVDLGSLVSLVFWLIQEMFRSYLLRYFKSVSTIIWINSLNETVGSQPSIFFALL